MTNTNLSLPKTSSTFYGNTAAAAAAMKRSVRDFAVLEAPSEISPEAAVEIFGLRSYLVVTFDGWLRLKLDQAIENKTVEASAYSEYQVLLRAETAELARFNRAVDVLNVDLPCVMLDTEEARAYQVEVMYWMVAQFNKAITKHRILK